MKKSLTEVLNALEDLRCKTKQSALVLCREGKIPAVQKEGRWYMDSSYIDAAVEWRKKHITLEEIKAKQEAESKPEEATETDATATFTDASGNVSESADITDTSLMMLTTNADVNIIINSGNVLYVNKYADIVNDNTADLKGDGTAVVVYKFNY